jgi:cyclopropane-fatty-acyl-phospholipid synthase
MLLSRLLNRLIQHFQHCTLSVIDAFGNRHIFGRGNPSVTIRLHDPALHWKLFINPLLYTGEAYIDESLTIIDGSLYDFLDLVAMNKVHTNPHSARKFTGFLYRLLRRLHQFNTTHKAKQNVAHHYDLSRQLYDLFLDDNRQYSCAYFPSGEEDLDTAQLKKSIDRREAFNQTRPKGP